jgi:hypothetical protein
VTDGTPAGTRSLASDILGFPLPGAPWANDPAELNLVDDKLVFVGTQASGAGREVFAYNAPGPHVIDLGLSGSGQSLRASTPKLGATLTIRGFAAPTGVSLLSYQIGTPQPSKALVAANSVAWLDPLNSQILSITNTPDWTYQTMLPNTATLAGLKVTCQSWTYTGSLPVETSNGLLLVLGQ